MTKNEPFYNRDLKDMNGEEWRDVLGYDGVYEVSNMGRVKSVGRYVNCGHGSQRWVKEKILTQVCISEAEVKLSIHGVGKSRTVATLVGDAFLRDRKKGEEVICKYDKDPRNCQLSNLFVMSISDSNKLSVTNGKLRPDVYKLSIAKKEEYNKRNGIFNNGKLTHIKCSSCKKMKPVEEYWMDGDTRMRRKCKYCLSKERGIQEPGVMKSWRDKADKNIRKCSVCKKEKHLTRDFCKSKNAFMGRSHNCKECARRLVKEWYQKKKEK